MMCFRNAVGPLDDRVGEVMGNPVEQFAGSGVGGPPE